MKILVIIVTYNAMQWAERCFDSLKKSTAKPDVFVVDNGSTDGTQAYIQEHYPEVMFKQSEKNLGFGKANNLGLQYALDNDYDYVYLLNQDAWVLPDTFERLISVSKRHPEYGVLSPMQLKANEGNLDENFFHITIRSCQTTSPFLVEDLFFGKKNDVYDVSFVMAAHWLITKKCIEKVGGFSPTFPHYGEDNNYIHRALFWNFKIGIVPSSKAVHDRADKKWNKKKEQYIKYYIVSLVHMSDPCNKTSLLKALLRNVVESRRNITCVIKYNFRLVNEYFRVARNQKLGKLPTAFLNQY